MTLKLTVKQGNAGLWRWQLICDNAIIAMPPVRMGTPSAEQSLEQARMIIADIHGGPRWFALWRAKRIPYRFVSDE